MQSMQQARGSQPRSPNRQRANRSASATTLLVAIVVLGPIASARAADDVPQPVIEVQREAAPRNRGVRALYDAWRAAEHRARAAGALPDPMVRYDATFMDGASGTSPQAHRVGVEQMVPWFGVRGSQRRAAEHEAVAARARYENAVLAAQYEIAVAAHALHLLERSTAITEDNLTLLQRFEQVVLARYRVGAAENADLLRLQVEMGRLEDRVRQLRDLAVPARARLNALLDLPVDTPWPRGFALDLDEGGLASIDSLRAVMVRNHPLLRARDAEADASQSQTVLARREGYPDFVLGVMRTFRSADDAMDAPMLADETMASVALTVPLWRGSIRAQVDAAQSRRSAVLEERRDAENELLAALQQALFAREDARRRVALYRDTLLPKAEESLAASLAGYEVGRTDFSALIDTERTLLEFRLALATAEVELADALALLARLVPEDVSVDQESER